MNTQHIGQLGEKAARAYLKKQGYRILAKNYKKVMGKIIGEIDIVAQKGGLISFVEVKTRSREDYGLPCEFVTKSKQQKIIRTAYAYIEDEGLDADYSFDIIEVLCDGRHATDIRHLPHAFMP
ncbi:MAG: YraN family protein [Ruminococcaceae bacterium]|nr:YraN family protein [Oscillospiraceae bacterium]